MKTRRRLVSAAALTSIVVLGALTPIATVGVHAASAAAQPNEVTNWNRIAADTLVAFPPPAGGAAPALQINMGMTQGAVYDAVNAIEPRHQPYLLATRFDPSASKEAAVATAAYVVLSNIVSTVPATIEFLNRASLLQSLATAYAASLVAIPDSPMKTAGIAAGNAAAAAMIAARQGDGRFGPSPWVSNTDPGHWQPQLNPDGTPILDPTPWVANVKPFLIQSSSQFRTEGPQDLRSDAWADDFKGVKRLGSVDSAKRTPEQTHIAIFWQSAGGPALLWSAVARNLIEDPDRAVDLGDSALLLARMNLAGADAAINCWNDKYYWDFWRPWQAIHEANRDDNPATRPDPSWTALITAPYPEHPSGHLCLDGAHLRVLRRFFGTDEVPFGVTSSRFPGEIRFFDRFSEPLDEIVRARVWAGLHYRTADLQARLLGRNVVRYMAEHYFQPVH
jgi:hypothetical protein